MLPDWFVSMALFMVIGWVDVIFSDNYFDVPAGRTVTITCPLPDGWSIVQAREKLKVRSLYDSFTSMNHK